jgi:hypothetical protein
MLSVLRLLDARINAYHAALPSCDEREAAVARVCTDTLGLFRAQLHRLYLQDRFHAIRSD